MRRHVPCLAMMLLLFSVFLVSSRTNAQGDLSSGVKSPEPKSFRLGLDYACFKDLADSAKSYVELYYSFNRRELKFLPEEQGLAAKVLMRLTILDEQGNEVESRMWNVGSRVKDAQEAEKTDFIIIDQVTASLKPGRYQITLGATDVNSMANGEGTIKAEVKGFLGNQLQLSDLELAFNIQADSSSGHLTKAGRKILPNPSRVFTHEAGMVYFYGEVYNLADRPSGKAEYTVSFAVQDTSGKQVKSFGEQTLTKPGNSAVVISGINIHTLDGGPYLLRVEAEDKETGQNAYATKKFLVLREKTKEDLASDEIKRFKQDVVYIASPGELDMFDQLNFAGKQNFIAEFWKKRDPNPETPENEFKIEHYRRISYANEHFSRTAESNDGWNTDMGRIYIVYGEPNDIERHTSTRGDKPWEQWNYHQLQGGAYFIFLDEDGYGVYRMVDSNVKGELQDSAWEQRIKSGTED
ncbi:MAG: GWxTD domain-containing protein [Candidatus Zixiibacteriota bacterium]